MPDHNIRITAHPLADGLDIDRLAVLLLELAEQFSERQTKPVRAKAKKLTAPLEQKSIGDQNEGAA